MEDTLLLRNDYLDTDASGYMFEFDTTDTFVDDLATWAPAFNEFLNQIFVLQNNLLPFLGSLGSCTREQPLPWC